MTEMTTSEVRPLVSCFFGAGGAARVSTGEALDVEDGTDEYVEIVAFEGSSIRSRRRCEA